MARNRRNKKPGRRSRNNRGPGLRGLPIPAVVFAGLPRYCKEEDVKRFLGELNLLEILSRRVRGSFTGVALCKLEELSDVDIALRQHRQKIGRHIVRVKQCEKRDFNRALVHATQFVYTPILKVQGLPSPVKKKDVIDFFDGWTVQKKSVKVGPRVAFVTFKNHAQFEAALRLNGKSFNGRRVELFPSHRQEMEAMASAGTTTGMEVATGATENAGAAAAGAWSA